MKKSMLVVAALDLLCIVPAALFMLALIIRRLPLHDMANTAQQIVMWYSGRMWTLWVLLLALPIVVLITGCVALFGERIQTPDVTPNTLALIHGQPGSLFVAGLTLSAAGILAVVILHMLAN